MNKKEQPPTYIQRWLPGSCQRLLESVSMATGPHAVPSPELNTRRACWSASGTQCGSPAACGRPELPKSADKRLVAAGWFSFRKSPARSVKRLTSSLCAGHRVCAPYSSPLPSRCSLKSVEKLACSVAVESAFISTESVVLYLPVCKAVFSVIVQIQSHPFCNWNVHVTLEKRVASSLLAPPTPPSPVTVHLLGQAGRRPQCASSLFCQP